VTSKGGITDGKREIKRKRERQKERERKSERKGGGGVTREGGKE